MEKNNGAGKFVLGAAIGAGLALLFAPKSGKELRKDLKVKMDELVETIKDLDAAEVRDNIKAKIAEIEKDIKNLDKETVIKIAKEKAKDIEKKLEELAIEAKKAAKPKVDSLVNEVRETTIKTLKSTVETLEKKAK